MPQVGRLVVKHLPVNGLAAAAVVVDDIAALDEHPLPNLKVAPCRTRGKRRLRDERHSKGERE
eukprot:1090942-Prymnesium_polylepis.1